MSVSRVFVVIGLGLGACGQVAKASNASVPTVSWLASSVPTASRIDLGKIMTTNSTGKQNWVTTGSCAVKASVLTTTKEGKCQFELSIAATKKHSAAKSSTVIQVKKKTEINVLAAASLATAMTELGNAYMSKFLNVTVKFNFAGSSTLVTQIQNGAPLDVFAPADTINMDKLLATGEINRASVTTLVNNKLAILVPRGNPAKILTLNDLTRGGLRVVLCDLSQPCGRYAATILTSAKVSFAVASREASSSGVVLRVANGEADAGIAYITDGLVSGDKVDPVKIDDSINVIASYPIGVAAKPTTKDLGAISAFVALAKSETGQKIFTDKGFLLPSVAGFRNPAVCGCLVCRRS